MTWPNVTINQINQRQGEIAEIERTLLFCGMASGSLGDKNPLVAINAQSDIATELELAAPVLRENVVAAQLNGGQNWQAYVLMIEPTSNAGADLWTDALDLALQDVRVEGALVCTEIAEVSAGRTLINALKSLRESLINKLGRRVWFIATVAGPRALQEPCSWADYRDYLNKLQTGIDAYGVQLVPALWTNEAGVLAGRLCNRAVTIADSPARVETGSLIGLGVGTSDLPEDAEGVEISLAHLQAFHDIRYSVPMWYADYEGMYWSDGLTLDVNGGDYQVIEHLRIVDKAARNVRIQAIGKIANRNLNTTPASIVAHETYFGRVLREMSRALEINGVTFPGEIEPPEDGSVKITWLSKKKVAISIVVRPYACPKEIVVNIVLDNTLGD